MRSHEALKRVFRAISERITLEAKMDKPAIISKLLGNDKSASIGDVVEVEKACRELDAISLRAE
jgi:hypothetical protein